MFPHRFGRFLPRVTHIPSENSILSNLSSPRGVAILGCEYHSQAGSANFGLHFILNTGYDLTTALGKCLMDPSSPLWHYSGLTSGKVYPLKRFPHNCNTQLEKP